MFGPRIKRFFFASGTEPALRRRKRQDPGHSGERRGVTGALFVEDFVAARLEFFASVTICVMFITEWLPPQVTRRRAFVYDSLRFLETWV